MFVTQKMQMFDKIYYSDKNLLSFLYEKIKITLSLWLTYSLVEF